MVRACFVMLFFCIACSTVSKAQSIADYDEVSVYLNVQQIDNIELTALVKDEKAYLPVVDIFNFLKIVNKISTARDSISGFFITEDATYVIDVKNNRITYKNKVYGVKPGDIVSSLGRIYIATDLFGKVFSLNCTFSFRNLAVALSTELELPAMREARISAQRTTSLAINGAAKADTTVKRTYPLFHFGMADWSVINTQETVLGNETRAYTALGGVIAGGETNVSLNFSSTQGFNRRDQFYSWRLANNDNTALRQIIAGKIYSQTISSIYAPVIGVTLTNTPTTYRRAYGFYTLTNTTFPNWTVELYVNNVLVSFVRTDAAGLYTFQVPLVYGASQIKLRFYGPSGEERYTEQNISIPYNFLPKNEFEYNATAGIVDDGSNAKFSRLSVGYGLSNKVTIGGGTEYLSSITSGTTIPFITSSTRLFNNLLLSGEYDYNVRTRAVASYNLLSGLQVELNDTWYKRGQTAIINTFLEERKAVISTPFRTKSLATFTRLTFDQIVIPGSNYTTGEWLVSVAAGKYIATVNTYGVFIKDNSPYIYTNLALTTTLFKKYLFTQQLQYQYRGNKVVSFKGQVEKHFLRNGYINLSYENNFNDNLPTVELGVRYDFSFAQAGISVRRNSAFTRTTQTANGSIIIDRPTHYTGFANYTNVGKGGITVIAFLDLNGNGIKDANEPKAAGLKIRLNGGRIAQNVRDSLIRVTDLEPYINYTVEIDPLSFENIAWRLRKRNFSIAVDPNTIKEVFVPVEVVSETSGRVSITNTEEGSLPGRFIVLIYNQLTKRLITRTTTEEDGYFSYMGLFPGDYYITLDDAQLKDLKLEAEPAIRKFHISQSTDGSEIGEMNFVLSATPVIKIK